MNAAELLEHLVSTPSVSRNEAAIAAVVGEYAADFGVEVHRSANNLWFVIGEGRPCLLVNSHLDTVPPCRGWKSDPYVPRWQGERLHGLGANDAKGCVTAMLAAAGELAHEDLAGSVIFALTAEEENGGEGLATILPRLGALDAAIVGEPTALTPCIAQRGLLLLKCVAQGKSAHVAHAEQGQNAIHSAARDVATLDGLKFEPHPALGRTRASVTLIEGGISENQVPDTCEFFVDLRTTPNLDHDKVVADLQQALESEVRIHSARYLPKATDAAHPIVKAAERASAKPATGSHTASDWAFLGDVPTVKIGPGDTRRSHCANEFLTRGELADGVAFYRRMVHAYFEMERAHE
jgi:acetylornithine deacetylase